MPRLPIPKAREVIAALQKPGFKIDHVTGSHYIRSFPECRRGTFYGSVLAFEAPGYLRCPALVRWSHEEGLMAMPEEVGIDGLHREIHRFIGIVLSAIGAAVAIATWLR